MKNVKNFVKFESSLLNEDNYLLKPKDWYSAMTAAAEEESLPPL